MSVFDRRVAFKPFEYPEILEYKNAINHSYWLVSEWNFISDVHDFKVNLSEIERDIVKKALLAISQIEVSVKKFWSKLGDRFPKSEFDQVGITFGESEVRHSDSYSHLLQVLGLNEDFNLLLENPEIQGRVDYLTKYLKGSDNFDDKNYTFTLTLFSIFVENVSLFSQFLIIKSFSKYKNLLKDTDNVVQATQKEETVHALFGAHVLKIIQKEFPEWFNEEFYQKLEKACQKAYNAESKIIDWIYRAGDLDFLPKEHVKEFIKDRFNQSLEMIGAKKYFEVNSNLIKNFRWFDEEILAETNVDFFYKKSTGYQKFTKAITSEDLF